jgi:hypothetical protein
MNSMLFSFLIKFKVRIRIERTMRKKGITLHLRTLNSGRNQPQYVTGTYTIYRKVCGHPVSDRCIKSSTQPCNLQKQTLAVEWLFWRAQWLSMWHRYRLSQVSSSNFWPARDAPSTVSAVIVKWKGLGATTDQPRSGKLHKLTERYLEAMSAQ